MIPMSPPSNASSSVSKADPSSSQSCSLSSNHAARRVALRSPRRQFSRQPSESQVPTLKSPNNNSFSEGRQSFAMPASRNDSTFGSHGGSSDGWSMHMFSELVASSQRERWSFDSENASSGHFKTSRSSSPHLASPSSESQMCGICCKLLTERSAWSTHKIIACSELAVIAVLVCGHVYHAECLENTTTEKDRYDPLCPVCTAGEKPSSKMFSKKRAEADWKSRNKISRIGVTDMDIDGDTLSEHRKSTRRESKVGLKMGASSSMKSSFARPFLRRHFSIGSKSSRAPSEVDSPRRKGFWTRYRKE
ncbi:hypothetical protein ACLOJK_001850 [Asimina triloba]